MGRPCSSVNEPLRLNYQTKPSLSPLSIVRGYLLRKKVTSIITQRGLEMLKLSLDLRRVGNGLANDFQEKKAKAFAHPTNGGTKRHFAATKAGRNLGIGEPSVAVQERFQFIEFPGRAEFLKFLFKPTSSFVQHRQRPATIKDLLRVHRVAGFVGVAAFRKFFIQ